MKPFIVKALSTATVVSASGLAVFANTQIINAQGVDAPSNPDNSSAETVIPNTEQMSPEESGTPFDLSETENNDDTYEWDDDDSSLVNVDELYPDDDNSNSSSGNGSNTSTNEGNSSSNNSDTNEVEEEDEEEEPVVKPKPKPKPKPDTETGGSGAYSEEEDEEEEYEEEEYEEEEYEEEEDD